MRYMNFGNCRVCMDICYFIPTTVLIKTEKEDITVSMVNDALDYILAEISLRDPVIGAYKKAKTVFTALKRRFTNQTPIRYSKEDLKITVDVLEEITGAMAKSDEEKEKITKSAFICKILIDIFAQN